MRPTLGPRLFYGHANRVALGGGSVGLFEEGIGTSNRRIVPYVLAIGLLLLLVAPMSFGANADRGGNRSATPALDYAIIRFVDPAVAEYAGGIPGYAATRADAGHRFDVHKIGRAHV